MAEARTEDEEEGLRESRGGRNPRLASVSTERAERNKPEQRPSSQGALSSIRAAIKRTSNRATAQTDHSRDRRRPEITILSAEPLPTNSWFPGGSGAFPPPPPPPPAQPSWNSGGLTVHLPPPSYEQVIREKSREQNAPHSSASSSSSSSSPTSRRSTVTIATQTDTDSSGAKKRISPPDRRPPKPPRPSLPLAPKPTESSHSRTRSLIELDEPDSPFTTHSSATTHGSGILSEPLSEQRGVQTDFSNVPDEPTPLEATPALADFSHDLSVKREVSARPRPRPRPRSSAILQPVVREEVLDQPMTREVKVQTLVRLKDDGGESVFAGFTDSPTDVSSNKYLQELLDVFGYDDQGFQGNQSSESDQSEKSEDEEEEDDEVSSEHSESRVAASVPSEPSEPLKRPEPRPRTFNAKPAIAPKPSKPVQTVQETENASEDERKQVLNPPVPAPRPLLTTKLSEESKPEKNILPRPSRPPIAARRSLVPAQAEGSPSVHQTSAVPPKPSVDDQHLDKQAKNSSSAPVKPTPVIPASSISGKCPPGPTQTSQVPAKPLSQRRPPPPSTTNTQVAAVGGVSVGKAPASSVPSLPPRPSEGKMLPLRPPPMKLPKSAGSSHVPATTNQLPSHRVPKRGPPLPPRPKPGHPLYKDYTSKVPRGNTKMTHPGTEPEKHYLQKEELLLDLDDTHAYTRTACVPREVKGLQDGRDDVCPAVKDEPISQQRPNQEGKRVQQEEQQPQPKAVRCVSRFAFEGQLSDELTFREGDVITLIEYVNEEWGRGSLDGHTGLFPLNFVQELPSSQRKPTPESLVPPVCEEEGRTGRAMYDFTPESEDELCLKVGDLVCALEEVDEEWLMGECGGKRGIVPKNYVQVL
ncbi:uncharacterized protein [Salminus brasiliensis]|uniref:uncharacterized protein isoform X2 n=1 Tax=Salminus brasiliensis TaxID=930266 RepID=UPI003B82FBC2